MAKSGINTPTSGGVITPIEPGVIQRLVRGVRYIVSGVTDNDWFGPGQPLTPFAQEQAQGRQFDYPVLYNTRVVPRSNEPVSFAQMRALADNYDLLRLVIETRKDQFEALDWTVQPIDKKAKRDDRCKAAQEFLMSPDKEHTWETWLRMWLEDLFVIDAPTIYPRMTRGGQLYALDLMDGATIKRLIDVTGRTPAPPSPAYQQILKGLPAVDYSRDELLYMARNVRAHRLYGFSPVEQIITTVNIALRRQIHQLQYYTEGNMPDVMIGVPETWQPDQIAQFQTWWDALLQGNTAERRGAKFVPGGMQPYDTKAQALKDDYDEWLARVVCFCFSVSPTPFIKQQNRATAENAAEQALSEGLAPLQRYLKSHLDRIIQRHMGMPDLEFAWADMESVDPLTRAQVDQIYVETEVKTPDEVRADLGLQPLTQEQKDALKPPAPPPMPKPGGSDDEDEDGLPPEAAKVIAALLKKNGRGRGPHSLTASATASQSRVRRFARY